MDTVVKKSFPITGMSCASCAASAQTILEHQPGIVSVNVNYANNLAQIEYNAALAKPMEFKTALQSIGYDLVVDENEASKAALENEHQQKLKSLKQKTIWSIVFSVPLVIVGMFFMSVPYANYYYVAAGNSGCAHLRATIFCECV